MESKINRSGFVNIVGLPNSGKSTLVNALSEHKLSIVSPKPQTTRARIFSICNFNQTQIIYSDLPGWIEQENYPMQKMMNDKIRESQSDADVLLMVVDGTRPKESSFTLTEDCQKLTIPKILVINKKDRIPASKLEQVKKDLEFYNDLDYSFLVSALTGEGVAELRSQILELIPLHEPYFSDDIASDKPIKFFLSELIREQIYYLFEDEIPFSTFVEITKCKGVDDQLPMASIEATIYTNKQSQIPILLGKNGSKIKELGIKSRIEIEQFLQQKAYLGLSIKLRKDWRNDINFLEKSGVLR